jgi:hypothetical protein
LYSSSFNNLSNFKLPQQFITDAETCLWMLVTCRIWLVDTVSEDCTAEALMTEVLLSSETLATSQTLQGATTQK